VVKIINLKIFMLLENAASTNKGHYSILNSPIGKIVVEDNDQHFSHPRTISLKNDKNNKHKFSSAKRTLFDTNEPDEIFNQGKHNKQFLL